MAIIYERSALNKSVANRKFEITVVHPSYIVGIDVYGRLVATIARGIMLGPLCVWVCEKSSV